MCLGSVHNSSISLRLCLSFVAFTGATQWPDTQLPSVSKLRVAELLPMWPSSGFPLQRPVQCLVALPLDKQCFVSVYTSQISAQYDTRCVPRRRSIVERRDPASDVTSRVRCKTSSVSVAETPVARPRSASPPRSYRAEKGILFKLHVAKVKNVQICS
jgi:hypothetical protein